MSLLNQVVGHRDNKVKVEQALYQGRWPSCSVFVGASGIGKKKLALSVAQALVCETESDSRLACGSCAACARIANEQSESLLLIEPEGTQLKIDKVKEIIRFVSLQNISRARIVIIDGAEKFNATSANALLKTLEEPPENTYFILLSTSLASLLPTIRSRSQVMRFANLSNEEVAGISGLSGWPVEASGGSVEAALQLGEQPDLMKLRSQFFTLLSKSLNGSASAAIGQIKDLVKDKEDSLFLARGMQSWVRDLYRLQVNPSESISQPDQREWCVSVAENMSSQALDELWNLSLKVEKDIFSNVDRQLSFESLFLKSGELAMRSR